MWLKRKQVCIKLQTFLLLTVRNVHSALVRKTEQKQQKTSNRKLTYICYYFA